MFNMIVQVPVQQGFFFILESSNDNNKCLVFILSENKLTSVNQTSPAGIYLKRERNNQKINNKNSKNQTNLSKCLKQQ